MYVGRFVDIESMYTMALEFLSCSKISKMFLVAQIGLVQVWAKYTLLTTVTLIQWPAKLLHGQGVTLR